VLVVTGISAPESPVPLAEPSLASSSAGPASADGEAVFDEEQATIGAPLARSNATPIQREPRLGDNRS
jgi:hypothetical protein